MEDDEDIRQPTGELLEGLGHDVMSVTSAEEALGVLGSAHVDVLLTDVSLPGMSGLELARQVLRSAPAPRVIIASGHGDGVAREGGDALARAVLLPKPYDLSRIQQALAQATDRGNLNGDS